MAAVLGLRDGRAIKALRGVRGGATFTPSPNRTHQCQNGGAFDDPSHHANKKGR
jgi:hypothetical protein